MADINIRITVTVPKEILNVNSIREKIAQAQRNHTGPELRREFGKTVSGWDSKPGFSQKQHVGSDAVSITVYPSGAGANIYELVNNGASPHIITPRQGGMLRFQTGYRAATRPRVISSRSKARFGRIISTPIVRHPGFEARAFDEEIAEQYAGTFADDMQDAIGSAAQIGR